MIFSEEFQLTAKGTQQSGFQQSPITQSVILNMAVKSV